MVRGTKPRGRLAEFSNNRKNVSVLLNDIKQHVMDESLKPTDRRSDIIHPSEMAKGKWCHRATYYRMFGYPVPAGKFSFVLQNIFAEGHTIHNKWQTWLKEMGVLWGNWLCSNCGVLDADTVAPSCDCERNYGHDPSFKYLEVPLKSTSLPIAGHADGAVPSKKCLIEIKSIGIGTLRFEAPQLLEDHTHSGVVDLDTLWKELRRPLASHVRQANVYLWLCQEMGLPYDSMVFLYEFKPNQQVKEFVIKPSADIMKPLLAKAREVQYALERQVPPACEYGGCKECLEFEKEIELADQSREQCVVQDGPGLAEGEAGGGEAADQAPEEVRLSGDARRPYRIVRRGPDEISDTTDGVGELSGRAIVHRPGGREVLLIHRGEVLGHRIPRREVGTPR